MTLLFIEAAVKSSCLLGIAGAGEPVRAAHVGRVETFDLDVRCRRPAPAAGPFFWCSRAGMSRFQGLSSRAAAGVTADESIGPGDVRARPDLPRRARAGSPADERTCPARRSAAASRGRWCPRCLLCTSPASCFC